MASSNALSRRGVSGKAGKGRGHGTSKALADALKQGDEWLDGSLAVGQVSADWMVQFQRIFMQAAVNWNETLAAGLHEVCQAQAPSTPASAPSAAQQSRELLTACGHAQDEWLRMTQGWIDTANALLGQK